MSEIEHVVEISKRLEQTDEEVAKLLNQEVISYEPIEINHARNRPESYQSDEQILKEVTAIKEQEYSDQTMSDQFPALELPYVNDIRLIHDLAFSSTQFDILSYELQQQGHYHLAQLAQNVGNGFFNAGKIVIEEATNTVKGVGQTASQIGQFAIDAIIDPSQAYFTTTNALHRCYQSIEYALVKFADFTEMIIKAPEEQVVQFLDEKITFNAAYDYVSNLSAEDIFRFGVQFTVNPWIRTKLLNTLPLCYKAVDGLAKQANKVYRAQKNKEALALASKFVKSRKLLRLYKKSIKSAKSGLGRPFSKTTQATIAELIEVKKFQLKLRYSASAVKEACKVLNFQHPEVVGRTKKPFKVLAEITRDIAKIDSNGRWHKMSFDPAEALKRKFKNVKEAIAGIACEEQGLLQLLTREPTGKSEFIDKFGKFWDVKAPTSYALNGTKIFNTPNGIKAFTEKLKKDILKDINEHFIIDLTHLHESDHSALYGILKKLSVGDLKKMIVIDATNPRNSKTTRALLKFLGY